MVQQPKYRSNYKEKNSHKDKHPIVNLFLILMLVSSLGYFGVTLFCNNNSNLMISLISSLILILFSILFFVICITNPNRKKGTIILGSFLLILSNVFGSLTTASVIKIPSFGQVEDFTGKSLTEVVAWATKNKVLLVQDYEYSDMIPTYSIISQDIKSGTRLKDVKELKVAVSEGANPDKEIIIPDMLGWDSNRFLEYVKDNHLNNVEVEFVQSDKAKDTVIEQSNTGSRKRSDELKVKFSLGEEVTDNDVKLIDLINKSEFEATFYLKQNRIAYEVKRDFSKKIERGKVSSQSVKAGDMTKVNDNDNKLIITVSKGKEIKVPDLKKMSMVEITDWIITNKLKLEFTDRYDDSVKENSVIEANYSKGDSVEQGSTIKVVISKGNLVMRDFKSLDEFKEWANKYGISYREEHEFNDDVSQGDVISYSYKKGDTIKNGDTIVVKISDGKECKVPNLIGMSKKEVISKLESLNLNYNFVYQSSNRYSKDKVIKQSISAGSKVSSGTTITVTLSNGKKEESNSNSSKPTKPDNSGEDSDSGNSNVPSPPPEPVCNSCYIRPGELKSIILNNSGSFNGAANAVRNFIMGRCSGVNVIINDDGGTSGFNPGSYVSGWEGGNFNSCDTITITLAK